MRTGEIRVIVNLVTEGGQQVRELCEWIQTDAPAKGDRITVQDTTYAVLDRRWAILGGPACVVSVSFGIRNEHLAL